MPAPIKKQSNHGFSIFSALDNYMKIAIRPSDSFGTQNDFGQTSSIEGLASKYFSDEFYGKLPQDFVQQVKPIVDGFIQGLPEYSQKLNELAPKISELSQRVRNTTQTTNIYEQKVKKQLRKKKKDLTNQMNRGLISREDYSSQLQSIQLEEGELEKNINTLDFYENKGMKGGPLSDYRRDEGKKGQYFFFDEETLALMDDLGSDLFGEHSDSQLTFGDTFLIDAENKIREISNSLSKNTNKAQTANSPQEIKSTISELEDDILYFKNNTQQAVQDYGMSEEEILNLISQKEKEREYLMLDFYDNESSGQEKSGNVYLLAGSQTIDQLKRLSVSVLGVEPDDIQILDHYFEKPYVETKHEKDLFADGLSDIVNGPVKINNPKNADEAYEAQEPDLSQMDMNPEDYPLDKQKNLERQRKNTMSWTDLFNLSDSGSIQTLLSSYGLSVDDLLHPSIPGFEDIVSEIPDDASPEAVRINNRKRMNTILSFINHFKKTQTGEIDNFEFLKSFESFTENVDENFYDMIVAFAGGMAEVDRVGVESVDFNSFSNVSSLYETSPLIKQLVDFFGRRGEVYSKFSITDPKVYISEGSSKGFEEVKRRQEVLSNIDSCVSISSQLKEFESGKSGEIIVDGTSYSPKEAGYLLSSISSDLFKSVKNTTLENSASIKKVTLKTPSNAQRQLEKDSSAPLIKEFIDLRKSISGLESLYRQAENRRDEQEVRGSVGKLAEEISNLKSIVSSPWPDYAALQASVEIIGSLWNNQTGVSSFVESEFSNSPMSDVYQNSKSKIMQLIKTSYKNPESAVKLDTKKDLTVMSNLLKTLTNKKTGIDTYAVESGQHLIVIEQIDNIKNELDSIISSGNGNKKQFNYFSTALKDLISVADETLTAYTSSDGRMFLENVQMASSVFEKANTEYSQFLIDRNRESIEKAENSLNSSNSEPSDLKGVKGTLTGLNVDFNNESDKFTFEFTRASNEKQFPSLERVKNRSDLEPVSNSILLNLDFGIENSVRGLFSQKYKDPYTGARYGKISRQEGFGVYVEDITEEVQQKTSIIKAEYFEYISPSEVQSLIFDMKKTMQETGDSNTQSLLRQSAESNPKLQVLANAILGASTNQPLSFIENAIRDENSPLNVSEEEMKNREIKRKDRLKKKNLDKLKELMEERNSSKDDDYIDNPYRDERYSRPTSEPEDEESFDEGYLENKERMNSQGFDGDREEEFEEPDIENNDDEDSSLYQEEGTVVSGKIKDIDRSRNQLILDSGVKVDLISGQGYDISQYRPGEIVTVKGNFDEKSNVLQMKQQVSTKPVKGEVVSVEGNFYTLKNNSIIAIDENFKGSDFSNRDDIFKGDTVTFYVEDDEEGGGGVYNAFDYKIDKKSPRPKMGSVFNLKKVSKDNKFNLKKWSK